MVKHVPKVVLSARMRGVLAILVCASALLAPSIAAAQTQADRPRLSADDQLQIAELVSRYNHHLDSRECDELGSIFHEDGALVVALDGPETRYAGRAKVLEFCRTTPRPGLFHIYSNLIVRPTSDGGATATSFFFTFRAGPKGSEMTISNVMFHDVLVKTPGGWRFMSRTLRRGPAVPTQ